MMRKRTMRPYEFADDHRAFLPIKRIAPIRSWSGAIIRHRVPKGVMG